MKEIVFEHLRKKDFNAELRQAGEIDLLRLKRRKVSHHRSVDAFHHQKIFGRILSVDFGHIELAPR